MSKWVSRWRVVRYSGWGIWDADTNYSGELTESYATVAALGGSSAWARTGHTFVVGGSGNGYYRIDMDCSWLCGSVNWGTNTLTLFVEERRDSNYSSQSFTIDQYSALAYNHSGDFDYSTPTNIRLYAGATYRISLKVETQASTLASAAGADCLTDSYRATWDYLHLEYSS